MVRQKGAEENLSSEGRESADGPQAGRTLQGYPDTAGSLLAESLTGTSDLPPLADPGHGEGAARHDRHPVAGDDEI